MAHQILSTVSLSLIKKRARFLSRPDGNKSYMQYLDQVAREQFGVRHYHEAQTQAKRKIVRENISGEDTGTVNPVAALCMDALRNSYLNSCQQYYLDI